MLSKIYYGLGIGVVGLYLLVNLLSWRSSSGGVPQARPLGKMRMEKGKYVYVPPTSYPSSGSNPYSSGSGSGSGSKSSGSRSSSYPSSGGYSGGK
ncbi:MAG: hypothetical protein LH472_05535 [Pyrinomonadaceae bacterium]|nr:hypothetical protein [Pyrinomonadaceae bacterium]